MLFEDTVVVPLAPTHTHRGVSGSILERKDGSLLFACGNPADEIHPSGIIGRISADGGSTWGAPFSMQKNIAKSETVAPSLLRLQNGDILFGYNVLNNWTGPDIRLYDGHFYVRRSCDEGKSWSDQICATLHPGFHTVQPQSMVQLSSGRIIVPAEWSKNVGGGEAGHCVSLCYWSDDGHMWVRSRDYVDIGTTTEEPSVVELDDGRLLMAFRCIEGYVGHALSHDGGDTWKDVGLYELPSPLSRTYISRIPDTGHLLLLWNNNPHAPGRAKGEEQPEIKIAQLTLPLGSARTPLTSAISEDGGRSWKHIRNIASDPAEDYGYPSVTFVGKVALVNYNAIDGIHVARIAVEWFYGEE